MAQNGPPAPMAAWSGTSQTPIDLMRAAGLAIMVVGAAMAQLAANNTRPAG